jgi:hypothetical protein
MISEARPVAIAWLTVAFCWCALVASGCADAATLAAKAKESGCTGRPTLVEGSMYKCTTSSGYLAYFNVPGATGETGGAVTRGGSTAAPQGFPKVDAATQKSRDTVRRRVLAEELAAEQKLLAEARAAYGNGSPPISQEEKDVPQKYTERITRLRQAVNLHEKNIEALQKELASTR